MFKRLFVKLSCKLCRPIMDDFLNLSLMVDVNLSCNLILIFVWFGLYCWLLIFPHVGLYCTVMFSEYHIKRNAAKFF